jgi:hypothetical protein
MYAHTQFGWITVVALVAALVVIGAAATELGPESPGKVSVLIAMALFALAIPLLGWLTVTVDEVRVTARFGVGLVRKKIKIKDIQNAARVRNKWYYGWGIRMGPSGWMFNVSGLDAVEIELKNGGKFRIGTDEPEELTRTIKQKIEVEK